MKYIRQLNWILPLVCSALFAYQWYLDQPVPAWQALIWCFSVFLHEFGNYLESK